MHKRIPLLVLLSLICLPLRADASGKKEVKFSITFHSQTDGMDNPKMIFPQTVNGRNLFFRRVPEIGSKDIQSFAPFPADDGQYGLVLQLKPTAANRIFAVTTANQGQWLLALVNGRVADAVIVDKPINDGRLVIWKRVTLEDIALLDKELPRTGEAKPQKKKSFFSN
ncbi:MAG: hypothetical protein V4733_00885 [Verrucomicrobiota bacterium]